MNKGVFGVGRYSFRSLWALTERDSIHHMRLADAAIIGVRHLDSFPTILRKTSILKLGSAVLRLCGMKCVIELRTSYGLQVGIDVYMTLGCGCEILV